MDHPLRPTSTSEKEAVTMKSGAVARSGGGVLAAPACALALLLAMFGAARVALLWTNADFFADLSAAECWRALARGTWFDVVTIMRVAGLPMALMALPWPGRFGVWWRGAWCWVTGLLSAGLLLLLAADVVNFPYITRHFGPEIAFVGENLGALAEAALKEHLGVLLLLVAALAVLALAWRRIAARAMVPRRGATGWIGAFVATAAVVLGWHGSLSGDRLQVTDAFDELPVSGAQLVLNGPFVLSSWLEKSQGEPSSYLDWQVALDETRELVFAPGEESVDPARPLLRARPSAVPRPWNAVIVLLEGWSADSVDVLRLREGLAPLGCTPRFDALAARGWLLTRCYATGQRTLYGYQALLAGMPSFPGLPRLCSGLESTPLAYLPQLARAEGFSTWLVQATPRGSQAIESLAELMGFEHVLGLEDFAERDAQQDRFFAARGFDHELFVETGRCLTTAHRPFLCVIKTESTHVPHMWPDAKWERFGKEQTPDASYLNALSYADDALGAFFDQASAAGWADDTVFVVISDHIQRGRPEAAEYPPSLFHIPCLLLVPGAAPREWTHVTSQLDVIPTLAELLGWRIAHASLGRSLLDERQDIPRGALCNWGDLILRVEDHGWVLHDLQRRIAAGATVPGTTASAPELDAIEQHLLASIQVVTTLVARQAVAR